MSEDEKNPFKQEKKNDEWPEEALKRLQMQAERTGESLEKVTESFIKHIAEVYNCDDWSAEDGDLLVDWSESFFIQDRRTTVSGSGSNLSTFVGEFVGVDMKQADRRGWFVRNATQKWQDNANAALSDGVVGHYMKEGSFWHINTANGVVTTEESIEEAPSLGFRVGNDWLCLLSRAGRPYPHTSMGRYYYFLGNEKSQFINDGDVRLWRIDLTDDNRNVPIKTGVPCTIQVRPNTSTNEEYKDVLGTNYSFFDTLSYTDEWLPANLKPLLKPFKYWTDSDFVDDLYVPLDELHEAFESRKRTFTGRDGNAGSAGPLIITKGSVSRLSTEARDNEYDEDKRGYSLSLTSLALEAQHGNGNGGEVMCWVGSACHDLTSPFTFTDVDDEKWGYAEKSTVLVFGRIGVSVRDGEALPNLKVMGVYANNRRSRRRVGGGDTGSNQFE
jgi:hypothetical protein